MKRIILFFLLTIPLGVSAQIVLTNGSFSNGYIKGSAGTFTVTSLVGSSGLLPGANPPITAALENFDGDRGKINVLVNVK